MERYSFPASQTIYIKNFLKHLGPERKPRFDSASVHAAGQAQPGQEEGDQGYPVHHHGHHPPTGRVHML